MNRAFRVIEIAWLVIAVLSIFQLYELWGTFDQKFWIFLGFLLVAVFMFFFRRRQRQNFDKRNKS